MGTWECPGPQISDPVTGGLEREKIPGSASPKENKVGTSSHQTTTGLCPPRKSPSHCSQLFTQGLAEHLSCAEVTPHTLRGESDRRKRLTAMKLGACGNVRSPLQLQATKHLALKPGTAAWRVPRLPGPGAWLCHFPRHRL